MPLPTEDGRLMAWNMGSTIRTRDRVRRECNNRLHPRNMEAGATGHESRSGGWRRAQTIPQSSPVRVVLDSAEFQCMGPGACTCGSSLISPKVLS
jgi:hypothetical protein